MRLDKYGNPIYNSLDVLNLMYEGNTSSLHNITVDYTTELEQFEQISGISFNRYQPYDVPITEYDKNLQAQWFMPDEYYYFDVKLFCLNKCSSLIEINRVNEEFTEYEGRGLIKLLQWLKYFVDTCTEQNVLWGVGRGSSVSSYILYLIGVHRIDSIKYNLDWREFLR